MKKFNTFYFEDFSFNKNNLVAKFIFSFDKEEYFEEIIDFNSLNFSKRVDLDYNVINSILFHIHLALGISYYKLNPTSNLVVETGYLDESQKDFWKKFYLNGLGEFFFKNKILPNGLCNFISSSDEKYSKNNYKLLEKALLPIGGGKDSIVSIELLKKINLEYDLFVLNTSFVGKNKDIDLLKLNTAKIANKNILEVKRYMDNKILDFVKIGYYNGHVPITGIIAFVLLLVSYIYEHKYLILSNERSANFGNTLWGGLNINHQYSKSLEFELDFSNYVKEYINSEIRYFSLLRGMYEINIAKLFSIYGKKYFPYFSSCNKNFSIENKSSKFWCNNCPKCVFVFIILSAFLSDEEIETIFGENLYNRNDLGYIFRDLLGLGKMKPFECVGEKNEVLYSMYLYLRNRKDNLDKYLENSEILRDFTEKVLLNITENDLENLKNNLFEIYESNIPQNIENKLKELL